MVNDMGHLVGAISIVDLALVAQNVRAGADAASVVGFHRQRGAACGGRPQEILGRVRREGRHSSADANPARQLSCVDASPIGRPCGKPLRARRKHLSFGPAPEGVDEFRH